MLCGTTHLLAQNNTCNSSALAPVFKQDFGQATSSTATSAAKPGSTNYTYGSVATDGNYIITPLVQNANKNDWTKGGDHTGNTNGNMFLVNAGGNNSVFFRDTAKNLCQGSIFNFTAWLANVNTSSTSSICGSGLVYPKVQFNIKDVNGNILNTLTTGALPLSPVNGPPNWKQYGFQFSLPTGVTSVVFEMVDSYGGGAQCGNDVALDDILFTACTPQATVSLKTTASACANTDAVMAASLINNPFTNPVYQWQRSFDGGNTWTNFGNASATGDTLLLPHVTTGDNGLYRVLVGPDGSSFSSLTCITASNSITFTVNQLPVVSISNNTICTGSNLNLSAIVSGGSGVYKNYNWTGPNNFTSTINNPSINNADTLFSGIYSVTVVDSKNCSTTVAKPITVNTYPIVSAIQGDAALCAGKNIQLTDPVAAGTWTSSNTSVATIDNNGLVNALAPGNAIISYALYNSFGCSDSVTKNITVNPDVKLPAILGDPALCAGKQMQLTDAVAAGTWTSSNTSVATIDNNGLVNALAPGNAIISYTLYNSFGCSDSVTKNITVNPLPTVFISSRSDSICTGNTTHLSISSSMAGSNFNWSSSVIKGTASGNSNIANTTNNLITDTLINQGDFVAVIKYLITATSNNNCISIADSALATIYPFATAPNAGIDRTICLQDTIHLNANEILNGTGTWIQVSGPNTIAFSDIHRSDAVVSNITNGKYVFAWQSGNSLCSFATDTVSIVMLDKIKADFSANISSVCANSFLDSNNIKANNTNQSLASYQWYFNGLLINNSVNFPAIALKNKYDSATITLKAASLFGCRNDSSSKTIYFIHSPNPAFTLNDTIGCSPLNINIQNTTGNSAAYSYLWNFGNGQTSQNENPGNIIYTGSTSGKDTSYTIILKAFNQCDTANVQKTITVKSKAKINFNAVVSNNCSPLIVNFSNQSFNDTSVIYRFNSGDGLDSVIAATANFAHVYHTFANTIFNAGLFATNACGVDSAIFPISAKASPTLIDIVAKDSAVCSSSKTITFLNNTKGATKFIWNFGDGTQTTTTQSPGSVSHSYQQKGNYTISVLIENGCSDTIIYRNVFVYTAPTVSFNTIPGNICIGDSIHFTNTSDSLVHFIWMFGDNQTSSVNNPSHTYKAAGQYSVWLKGSLQYPYATCADSSNQTVTIVANKQATIKLSDSTGKCLPFNVTFVNKSIPASATIWNFGDGTTGVGDSVIHSYNSNGNFVAGVSATAASGCNYIDSAHIHITSPTGTLQLNNAINCASSSVNFLVNNNYTDSVEWNFGDGSSATTSSNTVSHNYLSAGIYYATVSLKNNNGCTITLPTKDTVKIDELIAGMKLSAVYDCGKTTFLFTDTSKSMFGIQSWAWSTNNTDIVHTQNISKTFFSEGKNTTSLIVSNSNGCSDTVKADYNVLIYQYPKATIESIGSACKQVLVNFNSAVSSRDSVVYRYWTFGNGVTSQDSTVKVMYYADGNYGVKLVISTINKCYDSAYKTIIVHALPTVVITGPNTICRGDSVSLLASGTNNYIWTDQNNNIICSNCTTVNVAPISNTTYQVIGYNEYGCSDIKTTNIKVIQPFAMSASQGDSICIGTQKTLSAKGADNYLWYPSTSLSSTNTAVTVAAPTVTTTYHVIGKDNYNCFADTANIKIVVGKPTPVYIGSDTVLSAGSIYQFNPVYNGNIKKWNWYGSNNLSCNNCATPTIQAKNDVCIICNTTNLYQCVSNDTLCIKVFCPSAEIFVPNAFSPDGDGINDKLMIQGKGIKTIKSFRIFSRWGELVFERKDFLPGDPSCAWDGTFRGKAVTSDVFVYVCEVVCDAGYPAIFKGNIAVLK